MIQSVTVTNHLSESIVISMGSPALSGFSIRGIDGLGPSKGDINTTDVLLMDGSYFNSSRVQERNIVLTLGFEANYGETVEELRLKTYKYFPVKKQIEVAILTDTRDVKVVGYVESNTPEIFSKDAKTTVSIICPDAYFYSQQSDLSEFAASHPIFEFPFSNESTTNPLLEMSTLVLDTIKTIVYGGDAEVGFYMSIKAIGTVQDLSIYDMDSGELMFINTAKLTAFTGDPIIAGDEVLISTVKGNKFVYLFRDGITYNILNCLDNTSVWFILHKGDNTFYYEAVSGTYNMTFEILYNTLYEGV